MGDSREQGYGDVNVLAGRSLSRRLVAQVITE